MLKRLGDRWRRATRPRRWWMLVRCCFPLRRGVTVVIVSWESRELIEETIAAVRHFSPPPTRIVVVDNASTDGSAQWLRTQPVKTIALHTNYGHGPALDLGALATRSTTVVALDVDAFPIASDWLDKLEAGLSRGAAVSGAHGGWTIDQHTAGVSEESNDRDFVHPCCLAIRLRRFVWRHHSFCQVRGAVWKDVGVALSDRERGRLYYLEPTSVRGPGALGTVFGGCVYHNFYGVRLRRPFDRSNPDGVTPEESRRAWDEAVEQYLRF